MKKCPECGNPSYDGAPVCGNCGFKFPKQKVAAPKGEDIFQKERKEKKTSNEDSILNIIKQKKLIIGIILLITLIVICGIVLTGSNNKSSPIQTTTDVGEFSAGDFSFKYPKGWSEVNETDDDHPGAKFFKNNENTTIEYYNVSTQHTSLKEVTQERISYAQETGSFVELVETITLDGRNASNIILENADGDYTRFVSMFSDGELYVFKISGNSINSITSNEINDMINSADIA